MMRRICCVPISLSTLCVGLGLLERARAGARTWAGEVELGFDGMSGLGWDEWIGNGPEWDYGTR
jgi:hypothetical protein